MSKVLITGGTGLIGRQLCKYLTEKGYTVCILSRNARSQDKYQSFNYDYKTNTIDEEALLNTDYIIHLAGANIGENKSLAYTGDIVPLAVASNLFFYHRLDSAIDRHSGDRVASDRMGIHSSSCAEDPNCRL